MHEEGKILSNDLHSFINLNVASGAVRGRYIIIMRLSGFITKTTHFIAAEYSNSTTLSVESHGFPAVISAPSAEE